MTQLYPPASNHNLNPEELEDDGSYFFVVCRGDRAVGCAGLVVGEPGFNDYSADLFSCLCEKNLDPV
ncbi:MAG: hypothetical protein AAGA60_20060 [Cyanobacteria bacterium P01_E01_bin.42]